MNVQFRLLAATTVIVNLLSTNVAAETQWRLGANLASYHIAATEEFNQFNPGAFLSVSFRDEHPFQYGFQFGGYVNSYSNRTLYGLAFSNYRVKELNNADLLVGGFVGFFEYPNLIEEAHDWGLPTVGNFVFALGPSLTLRMDNGVSITMGYLPVHGKSARGVLTLQTSIAIGHPRR